MHLIALREIIRDAEVAGAIRPVILRHHISLEDTVAALSALGVPRARGVARIACIPTSLLAVSD
jgi:hypothetical protein